MTKPKISVITPSFNQGEFIEETIKSVLDQQYPNLEYIIMDGGSKDQSVDIIKNYEKHLAYWVSEKDKGQTNAINKGFQKATGDILVWLNSDDFFYPYTFDYVAQAYQKHPKAGLYLGNGYICDKQGKIIRPHSINIGFDVETLVNGQNYIMQPSVFINRKAYQKIGDLDESLHYEMDVDYWIKIGKEFDVVVMEEFLSGYRWYEEIKTASGVFDRWIEIYRIIRKYTQKKLTPGLLVEFLMLARGDDVIRDLGSSYKPLLEQTYQNVFALNQSVLNLQSNIPYGRGTYFKPKPKETKQATKKTAVAPGVIHHLGSNPKVDIVLQATGSHAWNIREGFKNAAEKIGVFNRMFAPRANWGDAEVSTDDGLFDYLNNPQADIALLIGFDWHSQMLHNNPRWRERWMNADMIKIIYGHEAIEHACHLFNNDLVKQAALSSAGVVDGYIYIDYQDGEFLSRTQVPLRWMTLGVDETIFTNKVPFSKRKIGPFFRGQITPYYTNKTYEQRRELINFLIEKKSLEVLEFIPGQKPEDTVDDFNRYKLAVNFPTLSAYHPLRVFESMACGSTLIANLTGDINSDSLFKHGEHLFYFSSQEELLNEIKRLSADQKTAEKVARQGQEYCLANFSLSSQLKEIVNWADTELAEAKSIAAANRPPTATQSGEAREFAITLDSKKSPRKSPGKKIVIDGVTFQLQFKNPAGIYRVWHSLLKELALSPLKDNIVLLDRASSAPKVEGIKRRVIDPYDFKHFEDDSLYLQTICDEEDAGLFVSTYYTYPENTNSMIMLHDMIPEVKSMDMAEAEWRAKTRSIEKACAYFCISQSTMNDFRKIYPQYADRKIYLTPNAVSGQFHLHNEEEITRFKYKYNIKKPYFLLVGRRMFYKNAILFYRAFSLLKNKQDFEIVRTGDKGELEKMFKPYVQGIKQHVLILSDEDLSTAYSGATALVYPSQYEGFGLPILEAQRSGCPVITCQNSSLPEVGGDAAIYVDEINVGQMLNALQEIQQPEVRNRLLASGIENTKRFSWSKSGQAVISALEEIQQQTETMPLKKTDAINTIGRLMQFLNRQSIKGKLLGEDLNRLEEFFTGKTSFDYMSFLECEDNLMSKLPEFLEQILSKIGKLEDSTSMMLYVLALAFEGKGELQEALGAYSGAVKLLPEENLDRNYHLRLGYHAADLAYRLGEYLAARKFLIKVVLEVQPGYKEAIALLFKINKELGELGASGKDLLSVPMKPQRSTEFEETPLVSVLVSTYNSEEYMRGLLDDLEAQTIAGKTEIIIVDSGSQQNERAIVDAYQRQYPNIRYLRTEKRESVYMAWNRAIQMARGKYLTNANTDDRHAPDAFEIMSGIMEDQPTIGLVYADCAITHKKNTTLSQGPIFGRFRWPEPDRRLLFQVCYIGPQPMWRRALNEEFGGFDEKMTSAGDYEFWLRISNKTGFKHIPQVLGLYLMAEQSIEHRQTSVSVNEAIEARKRHWNIRNESLPPALGPVFLENYQATSKTGKKLPLVSVVIPTYNRPKELAAALDSIANQTYPEIEVIVVNDGGKDVVPVLQRFEKKLSLQYKYQEQNRGAGAARNAGMALARGTFIAFLDDDDIYRPEHLYTLVAELVANESIVAAYTDALQVVVGCNGDKGKVLSKDVYYSVNYSADLLLVRNYIPNLCLAFRREALHIAGVFDEEMNALEDWEWLIRLSRIGPFRHIPITTAEYVVRQGSKSRNILTSPDIASLYNHIYSIHASFASKPVQEAQKRYFQAMTGQVMEAVEPDEQKNKKPIGKAVEAVESDEQDIIKKPDGRAVETFKLLLDSEDLAQALEKHQDRLDVALLNLVMENANTARQDGNLELAEGLSDLAEYISSVI